MLVYSFGRYELHEFLCRKEESFTTVVENFGLLVIIRGRKAERLFLLLFAELLWASSAKMVLCWYSLSLFSCCYDQLQWFLVDNLRFFPRFDK